MMETILPKRLVHSGKKRAYPSDFVWDCPSCNHWNIWSTKWLMGKVKVKCQECRNEYELDKSNPKEVIEDRRKVKSIID